MKLRRNSIFVFLFSAVYIITVVGFVISLTKEYSRGKGTAGDRFQKITRETSALIQKEKPFSENFSRKFADGINNFDDIKSLTLTLNGRVIFDYPADKKSEPKKNATVVYKTTTLTKEDSIYVLEAWIYTLRPAVVFTKGRATFIIILTATVLLLIYILFFSDAVIRKDNLDSKTFDDGISIVYDENESEIKAVSDSSEKTESDTENFSEEDSEVSKNDDFDAESLFENIEEFTPEVNTQEKTEPVPAQETPVSSAQEAPVVQTAEEAVIPAEETPVIPITAAVVINLPDSRNINETQEEKSEETVKEDIQEEKETKEESSEEITEEEKNEETKEESKEETDDSDDACPETENSETEENNEPKGLFSPVTGFGWESYMIPRLDSELLRAAGSEQDISLFTIRIPGFSWKMEGGDKIAELITDRVKFNDLVFEYGDDGCTAIFQELNTESALKKAEQLNGEIQALLTSYGHEFNSYIGISTRSLRLISGQRIANESEQALLHAMEDKESSIVAFKVNPEKYRNYLSKNL
ncbi:MAG: hypothetical protein J5780_05400 [Treponema sp.]|nr:hypothetical protein [Treponema sp.]